MDDTRLAIMASSAPAVLEMATIAQSIKRAEGSHFFYFRYIGRCMRESLVPPMLFSKLSRGSVQRELSLDIRSQNQFLDHFHQKVIILLYNIVSVKTSEKTNQSSCTSFYFCQVGRFTDKATNSL